MLVNFKADRCYRFVPSQVFELLTGTIGDLLVGFAHLGGMGVDLSTTKLGLDGVKACSNQS